MKTGNKQQAIVLSVVAVGAIAFLGLQLKGIASRNTPQATPTQQPAAGPAQPAANVDRDLPKTLFSDPFSHPALPRTAVQKQEAPVATAKPDTTTRKLPILPGDPQTSPLRPEVVGISPEGAAPPRHESRGPTICLQAIISAPEPVAFLSINGKDPQRVSAGQVVFANVSVNTISEGAIELRLGKGTHKLKVGETIQL